MNPTPEQCVIGAMVYAPDSILYCIDHLSESDFADGACAATFAEIKSMYTTRGYFAQDDYVLMKNRETAAVCAASLPSISGYRKFVAAVKDASQRRRAARIGLQIAEAGKSVDDMRGLSAALSDVLTEDSVDSRCMTVAEVAGKWLMEQNDKTDHSIKTGLGALDRRCSIRPGQMVVVGGRPSAGKTALSLQMACEMARRGLRVCYFSLETGPDTLAARIIANRLAVPLADVKSKTVPQSDLDSLADLHKLPLFIRSASGKGTGWIKAQAQRMKAQVVFIDYLQLLADGKAKDRYQAITGISIALHELAQTTGILVVALAQLNRNSAQSLPTVADLKESGQIEQDADAILLLANDVTTQNRPEKHYHCSLEKNKEGDLWTLPITFDKEHQRFLEVIT